MSDCKDKRMSEQELGLHFGVVSKPIPDQLAQQGFKTQANFQTPADYITKLFVMGYLTESETKKARNRLLKRIAENIQPIGEAE